MRAAGNYKFSGAPVSKLFQERFIIANHLDEKGFAEWVLHHAMLFGSEFKWWETLEKRETPHEGLDLYSYRTKKGDIGYLDEKTRVPVIFNGRVVKVIDDFLGQSVFVSHDTFDNNGYRLHTIYGHIKPHILIRPGQILSEIDIIGTIADTGKNRKTTPPHLHISVAWISKTVSSLELNWQFVGDTTGVILLNPLLLIECPYSIEEIA